MRIRKIHFVIHNQGPYDPAKKDDLVMYLKSRYKSSLEGYLICQEMYKHQSKDSHLQGNFFLKNAVDHMAVVKYLKAKYTPKGQESLGRVEIMPVMHEGRAYNYMVNSAKEGGDPEPISDLASLDVRKFRDFLDNSLKEVIKENIALLTEKKYIKEYYKNEICTES